MYNLSQNLVLKDQNCLFNWVSKYMINSEVLKLNLCYCKMTSVLRVLYQLSGCVVHVLESHKQLVASGKGHLSCPAGNTQLQFLLSSWLLFLSAISFHLIFDLPLKYQHKNSRRDWNSGARLCEERSIEPDYWCTKASRSTFCHVKGSASSSVWIHL